MKKNLASDGDISKTLNPFFSVAITFFDISQTDCEAFENKFGNPF